MTAVYSDYLVCCVLGKPLNQNTDNNNNLNTILATMSVLETWPVPRKICFYKK